MCLLTVTQSKDSYAGSTQFSSTIKVEDIRCFYPRHEGSGTRITFRDGGGFAVLDDFETIRRTIVEQFPNLRFSVLSQIKREIYGEEREIPTAVNLDAVRNFYPRHDNKPGTRLTFDDGGGFAVADTYDYVLQVIGAGQPHTVLPAPAVPEPLQLVHNSDHDDAFEDEEEEEEEEF